MDITLVPNDTGRSVDRVSMIFSIRHILESNNFFVEGIWTAASNALVVNCIKITGDDSLTHEALTEEVNGLFLNNSNLSDYLENCTCTYTAAEIVSLKAVSDELDYQKLPAIERVEGGYDVDMVYLERVLEDAAHRAHCQSGGIAEVLVCYAHDLFSGDFIDKESYAGASTSTSVNPYQILARHYALNVTECGRASLLNDLISEWIDKVTIVENNDGSWGVTVDYSPESAVNAVREFDVTEPGVGDSSNSINSPKHS